MSTRDMCCHVMGRLFSKDRSAYAYLSESAASVFPHGEEFNNILRKNRVYSY